MAPRAEGAPLLLLLLLLASCLRPATLPEEEAPADTSPGAEDSAEAEDSAGTGGDDTGAGEAVAARSCGLSSDLVRPWFWEGDEIRFTVACTGELPTEAALITAVGLPEGAVFDAATRSLTWATDGADGGPWSLAFTVVDGRASPGALPEVSAVPVWVADNPDVAGGVGVDPLAYTEEWGLPVFHVSVAAGMTTEYQAASIVFGGKAHTAQIKIRGASSASYPKPSYTMEFPDDQIDVGWGPDDRDHLLLVTTFDDNSHVRQKLIYDQWAAMAAYAEEPRLTPRTFFAVLYLNGTYQGLFMALDRIDNEFVRHMGFDNSGNLYKSVNHDANFYRTRSNGSAKRSLAEGYTKEEGEPETDFSDLNALVAFTSTASDSELWAGLGDWVRAEEFMDWFWLVSFSLAQDSAGKNAYLYHEPVMDRFLFCPWDFNAAWGQSWYTTRTASTSVDNYFWANRVFRALQSDPKAAAVLWDRFRAMRADGPLSEAWMLDRLDAYAAEIEPSARRDEARWQASYRSYWWAGYRSDWTDWDGEMDYLRTWITERTAHYETLIP